MLSNRKTRINLSFNEGEVSLSQKFCLKNPNYTQLSYQESLKIALEEANNTLFRYLATRPRSIWECEQKLLQNAFLNSEVEQTLFYFQSQNWLNDLNFAQFLIQGTQSYKAVGIFSIQYKLKEKHVEQKIIDIAIARYQNENSFIEDGINLLQKQLYRFEKFIGYERKEKIKKYLYQRGFSQNDIQIILKKLKI